MTTEHADCLKQVAALAMKLEHMQRQWAEAVEMNRLLEERLEARHVNG